MTKKPILCLLLFGMALTASGIQCGSGPAVKDITEGRDQRAEPTGKAPVAGREPAGREYTGKAPATGTNAAGKAPATGKAPAGVYQRAPQGRAAEKDGTGGSLQKKCKTYRYKIEAILDHNPHYYTQGLFYHEGCFYESTGQYGSSQLLKTDRQGKVLLSRALDARYFGEGACLFKGRIYQLTWREHTCFVYDARTFDLLGTASYTMQGWGLTSDGKSLILSDGTDKLHFFDPETLMETGSIAVRENGKKVEWLNELEYIEGLVWANIYTSERIVMIDPATGNVVGTLNCKNLLPAGLRTEQTDVLNGIAFDPVGKRIWLTGKNWPKIYEISVY